MKKKGLFSVILGFLMAFSVTLGACAKETPKPQVEVETQGVPLGKFEIKTPSINATDVDVNPRVSWTAEANAEKYLVSVSEDSTFEEICAEEVTTRTYTAISQTLDYATKYYLRIYAMKENTDGNEVALSYKSTVFTTQADHETPNFDGTAMRTIHDFEDFENDDAIGNFFKQHTGGDPFVATLAQGEGVDGSNAMKLTYTKSDKGWSAVQSLNVPEKKNWNGATGIRFWIDSEGCGGSLTVSIGKRGYQRWSAKMTLNSSEPCYVSIPFSEFEDAGGGDGVWNQEIVRLWFYYHGTKDTTILLDDITIGADELHSLDTRENVEKPKKPIVVDTPFETFDDAGAAACWTIEYDADNNKDLTKSVAGTDAGIQVYDGTTFGTNSYTLSATGYDFAKANLTNVNGFRMAINSLIVSGVNSYNGAQMLCTVTIGSEGNYYQMTKEIFNYSNSYGQTPYIVCDFAGMTLCEGSTGELDKSKIDTLKITVTGLNTAITSHQFRFDDMEFYTAACGAQGAAFTSDFSDTSTQDWGSATFSNGIATRTATNTSGFSMTYKTATNSWPNYHKAYAIRFRIKTTNIANISVRLYNDIQATKGLKSATAVVPVNGEYCDYIVYFDKMVEATTTTHTSMKFQQIQFYATCKDSTGGTIECEKVELLIG